MSRAPVWMTAYGPERGLAGVSGVTSRGIVSAAWTLCTGAGCSVGRDACVLSNECGLSQPPVNTLAPKVSWLRLSAFQRRLCGSVLTLELS